MELESLVVGKGPYPVNIFCLSALEQGRMYAERGGAQMRGRYNIGYWPWELEQWPERWRNLVCLVDEIWVSTRHTLKAVRDLASIPVRHMPMAVCTDAPGKPSITLSSEEDFRHTVRRRFSLPREAYLFCFSFDLNSSIHRKNPQACLQAFQKAFPRRSPWNANGLAEHEVGLVIKIHPPAHTNRQWEKLQRMVKQDSRLHLVIETLPRQELLDLYRACDCFVSLHRAEGFGRGIAEALLLGLDVIATGYSGNVDFCNHPLLSLVPYSLVPVRKGQYPFGEGCRWAEPDVSEAAKQMRKKFAGRGPKWISSGWAIPFDPAVVGRRYQQRLKEIYQSTAFAEIPLKEYPRTHHM
jgi:glycosyltransferase involved in cell wall biosynthesis